MSVIKQIYNSLIQGPIYLILIGLAFFGIGGWMSYSQFKLEREGGQAHGEVIRMALVCDNDGCTHAPVVRFLNRNEETITFQSTYSSSPPSYEVGDKVEVVYNLDVPDKAEIKGEGKLLRIIFMSVGGLITTVGLVMFSIILVKSYNTE